MNKKLVIKDIRTLLYYKRYYRKLKKQYLNTSDEEALVEYFKLYSGLDLNLEKPTLLSEKIQWLKLNYYDHKMVTCADKYAVRDYLQKLGYGKILNELIDFFDDVDDISIDDLPEQFVLKCTHGSGWNLICKNKKDLNWFIWKRIFKLWLRQKHNWVSREWVYKDIKPRIICEKYLQDSSGELTDYKVTCFNGVPKCIQIDVGRFSGNHIRNYYDLEWNIINFGMGMPHRPDIIIPKPTHLDEMINISTKLSEPFPLVRVDFYNIENRLIFGELTFFPGGGILDVIPEYYDRVIGDWLELPQKSLNL